jgi:hypothetical protein
MAMIYYYYIFFDQCQSSLLPFIEVGGSDTTLTLLDQFGISRMGQNLPSNLKFLRDLKDDSIVLQKSDCHMLFIDDIGDSK